MAEIKMMHAVAEDRAFQGRGAEDHSMGFRHATLYLNRWNEHILVMEI